MNLVIDYKETETEGGIPKIEEEGGIPKFEDEDIGGVPVKADEEGEEEQ
ncbi:hypothetical protein ACFL24_02125 [Patescibacteria group bacterium]